MGFLSVSAAEEIKQINLNGPKINEESYGKAFKDICSLLDEETMHHLSNELDAAIFIAAAIHELSYMLNEHLTEFMRVKVEEKHKGEIE